MTNKNNENASIFHNLVFKKLKIQFLFCSLSSSPEMLFHCINTLGCLKPPADHYFTPIFKLMRRGKKK